MATAGNGQPRVFGTADQVNDFIDEDTVRPEGMPALRRRSQENASPEPPHGAVPAPDAEAARPVEAQAVPPTPDLTTERPAPAPTSPPRSEPAAQPTSIEVARTALHGDPSDVPAAQKARASMGARGVFAKLGLPIGPNAAEVSALALTKRRFDAETIVRQSTWTRPVSILVANPGGGQGKTTTSLLLGGTLATIRGGSVVIPELADAPGMLAYRAEGSPSLGIGELVQRVHTLARNPSALAGYAKPQTSFAAVIGSTGRRPTLTGEDVRAVMDKTEEFYMVRVMDTGNDATSSAFTAAAGIADVLVIPVMGAADSAEHALQLLDELKAGDEHSQRLAATAIVLRLTDGRTEHPETVARVDESLHQAGVRARYTIPYDQHIADRGELTLSKLQPATRDAFTFAAAEVVQTLNEVVTERN